MKEQAQELLTAVASSLVRALPAGWERGELEITAAGGMTETGVVAYLPKNVVDRFGGLDNEGLLAAHDLREVMFEPGRGSWYNARVTVSPDGEVEADFDYDEPPFAGDADDELLRADQVEFPRAAENLPAWHPARG